MLWTDRALTVDNMPAKCESLCYYFLLADSPPSLRDIVTCLDSVAPGVHRGAARSVLLVVDALLVVAHLRT